MKQHIRWPLGVVLFTFALSVLSAPSTPPALNDGYAVVESLKARYADTARECADDSPGLNCNGVLVRAISRWDDPKFWNPTSDYIKRNAISFSYIRDGCGNHDFPKPCPDHGITDVHAWVEHASQVGEGFFCYMEPTAHWFQFSIDVRQRYDDIDRGRWNEIVVAVWPQDIPEQLPIQALFYLDDGLAKAQKMQQSFFAATGILLPIIKLALNEKEIFSYSPDDQTAVTSRQKQQAAAETM